MVYNRIPLTPAMVPSPLNNLHLILKDPFHQLRFLALHEPASMSPVLLCQLFIAVNQIPYCRFNVIELIQLGHTYMPQLSSVIKKLQTLELIILCEGVEEAIKWQHNRYCLNMLLKPKQFPCIYSSNHHPMIASFFRDVCKAVQ